MAKDLRRIQRHMQRHMQKTCTICLRRHARVDNLKTLLYQFIIYAHLGQYFIYERLYIDTTFHFIT